MHIEIINTGSELLIGSTLNTHGAWLGNELLNTNLRVQRQITVPDGDAIGDSLLGSMRRSDVVIVTGGIGPTSDDLTREAAARVIGVPLVSDPVALTDIEAYFTKLYRVMAVDNVKQANKPEGATIIPNANGTAPGVYAPAELNKKLSCALFLLPGPPNEMHPMFMGEVLPRILETASFQSNRQVKILKFSGIGESDFHAVLDDHFSKIEELEFGYCARPGELDLRLIGTEKSVQAAAQLALQNLPQQCFSQTGESLENVVVDLLTQSGKKLSLAESCTGGGISNRITGVSGSSTVFTHGFVTYSNEAKADLLDVDSKMLEQHGAVSEPVALAMAKGALKISQADIAAAVTGIAGPTGGSEDKPVGTVWIAVATPDKAFAIKYFYPRGREVFKQLVSQKVLDLIRLELLS